MQKHTNPFLTIAEATSILKALGADPIVETPIPASADTTTTSGATYPFPWGNSYGARSKEPVIWQDHIVSIHVNRIYDLKMDHHFEIQIHVDREGFDALAALTGCAVLREPHSAKDDMLVLNPGTLLRVFHLVHKEVED